MKKTVISALGFFAIPFGAILLNACGPVSEMPNNDELVLDQASSKAISEYGHCNDAWDNDGNGLVDMHDPLCHVLGPIRDLSLHDFPVGHNYFPDITKIPEGGPGEPGGFRDPEQITRWLRFLTGPHGYVAGIDLYTPGVNPGVVPYPAPLAEPSYQGSYSQGNNYNLSIRDLHQLFLEHDGIVPPSGGPLVEASEDAAATQFQMDFYKDPRSRWGGWPDEFYGAQGPNKWGVLKGEKNKLAPVARGSQGGLQPARTGNPEGR